MKVKSVIRAAMRLREIERKGNDMAKTHITIGDTLASRTRRTRHPSITLDRIMEMVERDELEGICGGCGEDAMNVEPDARMYECKNCGKCRVYGAQEWLLMGSASVGR